MYVPASVPTSITTPCMYINVMSTPFAIHKKDIKVDDPDARPNKEDLRPGGDPLKSYKDVLIVSLSSDGFPSQSFTSTRLKHLNLWCHILNKYIHMCGFMYVLTIVCFVRGTSFRGIQ